MSVVCRCGHSACPATTFDLLACSGCLACAVVSLTAERESFCAENQQLKREAAVLDEVIGRLTERAVLAENRLAALQQSPPHAASAALIRALSADRDRLREALTKPEEAWNRLEEVFRQCRDHEWARGIHTLDLGDILRTREAALAAAPEERNREAKR